ncbi:MAG: hypothetical protein U9Q21_04795 [Candidatus Auribacterota bacterium]|nr:hypothetical protein [Candidatus Auribacterota bacterium]
MNFVGQLVILITFTLSVISLSFAQENLIVDSSFEESPHASWVDWKDYGPGIRDFDNTEKVYSGIESYKVTVTDASSRWDSEIALQEYITEIRADDKFEANAYFMIPKDNPLSGHVEAYLEVIFFDGKRKEIEGETSKFQSQKYGYGKCENTWTKLTIKGIAPPGAGSCKLQLVVLPLPYFPDSGDVDLESEEIYSGTIYFDDVSLVNKSREIVVI